MTMNGSYLFFAFSFLLLNFGVCTDVQIQIGTGEISEKEQSDNPKIWHQREFYDPSLIVASVVMVTSYMLTNAFMKGPYKWKKQPQDNIQFFFVSAIAGAVAFAATDEWEGSIFAAAISFIAATIMSFLFPRLTPQAAMIYVTPFFFLPLFLAWQYFFLKEIGMPQYFIAYFLVINVLTTSYLFLWMFVCDIGKDSMFTHRVWQRPNEFMPRRNHGRMVSIHLCCYAEPPDMVIETLEYLSRLDYDNFEVLVCDNNTKDPNLWKPLEPACEKLNLKLGKEVFKFFHVAPLAGAKSGALNFCLTKTNPNAEFIGLIDADYLVKPEYISSLIGFFDNESMGFVQTPHDAYDHKTSLFKEMCHWEYNPTYKGQFPSRSEYYQAFTVGTMNLYRREAIEKAGGWAEWCLTEDAEIAFRIFHQGYEGIFLNEPLGAGVIPEQWEDYRKQRFRWTAGPVQMAHHHFWLYLKALFFPATTKMNLWMRIHLLLFLQMTLPSRLVQIVVVASITLLTPILIEIGTIPSLDIPFAAWLSGIIVLPVFALRKWIVHRLSGGTTLREFLLGVFAQQALFGVRLEANISALLYHKPMTWVRTPKFAVTGRNFCGALAHTPLETFCALLLTGLGLAFFLVLDHYGNISFVLATLSVALSVPFYCGILMAIFGEAFRKQPTSNTEKCEIFKKKSDCSKPYLTDEEGDSGESEEFDLERARSERGDETEESIHIVFMNSIFTNEMLWELDGIEDTWDVDKVEEDIRRMTLQEETLQEKTSSEACLEELTSFEDKSSREETSLEVEVLQENRDESLQEKLALEENSLEGFYSLEDQA